MWIFRLGKAEKHSADMAVIETSSMTPEDKISEALVEIDQEITAQILDKFLMLRRILKKVVIHC